MRMLTGFALLLLFSCTDVKEPDVSKIKLQMKTERFERDLFKADTANFKVALDNVLGKYPGFGENYVNVILGIDPRTSPDTTANLIKSFLAYSKNVYDTSEKLFKSFEPYEAEILKGTKLIKYYFPKYRVPGKIITYIGPADGFGDILDDDAYIVGLQSHLGADFPLYQVADVQKFYPGYITARFTPEHISVNAMRNVVDDMFPEVTSDQPLIVQMIEKGKRLYLLSRFLPKKKEQLLIGYTEKQWKDSYGHEAIIWNLFTQNNYLQSADANVIKNYLGESPRTQELGEGAPGNIGSFAGWQIVKKYMAENSDLPLSELMVTDAQKIFAAARYKP